MHYMKYIIHVASVPVQLACRHHASLISAGVYTNTGREGGAGREELGERSMHSAACHPQGMTQPLNQVTRQEFVQGNRQKRVITKCLACQLHTARPPLFPLAIYMVENLI